MTDRQRRLLILAIAIVPRLVVGLLLVTVVGVIAWLLAGCASLWGVRHA